MNKPLVTNLTLLLIAFIWGVGFVPQRIGMDFMGPAAFNALRFALGAVTLVPLLVVHKSVSLQAMLCRPTLGLGVVLGALLFGGALFQQFSLQYTSLANVAFITGLYVILVPLIGFFIGYKYRVIVWIGGLIGITGLYLMTGTSTELALQGDLLALVGAVFWAMHLLVLAKKSGNHNQLVLAFYQFIVCAIFSVVVALVSEDHLLPYVAEGYLWAVLNGVLVVGGGYTLQVLVMEHAEPFVASLILALEAVFGALAGYLVFSEQLGKAALLGAVMMLLGCVLAQLPGTSSAVKTR
ncbi:MAG: DMT family transporter [Gammaproteobacteria bacterium]|nr:DMT family transporter [Gammaproteobacteria bacterium]